MELSENALLTLRARYLLKDENGKVREAPEAMFMRVAKTVASAEDEYKGNPSEWEERFYSLMTDLKFLPNSPTLMNAGKETGQLAACFVLPIDVNRYPIPEIQAMHKGNRKIGLGVMGWADLLILLGIPYNHEKAFRLAKDLMKFVRDTARGMSAELAQTRGVFPNFRGSVYDSPGLPRLRNATTTTIAPTGTLSLIADCSSGVEPLFALAYKRLVLDTELYEINRYFFQTAREEGFYSEELKEQVIKRGFLRGIKGVPDSCKKLFRTAHEIPPEDHIEMQACFQEYTDNAVSKTINLPHRSKRKDVAKAYLLAYEKECKGITIFRYGTGKGGTLVRFSETD